MGRSGTPKAVTKLLGLQNVQTFHVFSLQVKAMCWWMRQMNPFPQTSCTFVMLMVTHSTAAHSESVVEKPGETPREQWGVRLRGAGQSEKVRGWAPGRKSGRAKHGEWWWARAENEFLIRHSGVLHHFRRQESVWGVKGHHIRSSLSASNGEVCFWECVCVRMQVWKSKEAIDLVASGLY